MDPAARTGISLYFLGSQRAAVFLSYQQVGQTRKNPLKRAKVCAEDSSLCVILTTRNDWACLHLGFPLFLRVLFVSELEPITIDSPNTLNSTMILPPSRVHAATLLYLCNYKPQPILTYKQGLFSQQFLEWQFRIQIEQNQTETTIMNNEMLKQLKATGQNAFTLVV